MFSRKLFMLAIRFIMLLWLVVMVRPLWRYGYGVGSYGADSFDFFFLLKFIEFFVGRGIVFTNTSISSEEVKGCVKSYICMKRDI